MAQRAPRARRLVEGDRAEVKTIRDRRAGLHLTGRAVTYVQREWLKNGPEPLEKRPKSRAFAKLQREWYAKLKESGFHDLEPAEDGALSNRGNLHPVSECAAEDERLAHRMNDGAEYASWAESVLHDGPRFASLEEREAWRLHAEGLSEADIATALAITRHQVRGHLAGTRERVSKVSKVKRWQNEKLHRERHLRRLVRNCDPQVLTALVALMATRRQERRSPSRSS